MTRLALVPALVAPALIHAADPTVNELMNNQQATLYCNEWVDLSAAQNNTVDLGYVSITLNRGFAYGAMYLRNWDGTNVTQPFDTVPGNVSNADATGIPAHLHATPCDVNAGGTHWRHDPSNYGTAFKDYDEFWFRLYNHGLAPTTVPNEAAYNALGYIGHGMLDVSIDHINDLNVSSIVLHNNDPAFGGDKPRALCCNLRPTVPEQCDAGEVFTVPEGLPEEPEGPKPDGEEPTTADLAWGAADFYCNEWEDVSPAGDSAATGYASISISDNFAYGAVRLSSWTGTDVTAAGSLTGRGAVAHLHAKPCADNGGGHWKADYDLPADEDNEFWFRLKAMADYALSSENNDAGFFGSGMTQNALDVSDVNISSIVVHHTTGKSVCCDLKRTAFAQRTCAAESGSVDDSSSTSGASAVAVGAFTFAVSALSGYFF